jgi:hypothetical protein
MLNIISPLFTLVFNAIKYLLEFLLIVFLGVVGAILYVLPWLLRMASLLLWLTAAYIGFTTIHTIYAPFSPAIPVFALQFAVILISVGWVIIVLGKNTSFVWGGMAAVGLVVGGASIGSIWLLAHWQHADLFFRVLPPAMFSVLLIYETIHLRSLRSNQTDKEIVDDTEENTAQ